MKAQKLPLRREREEERDLLGCAFGLLAESELYALPPQMAGHTDHVPFLLKESVELHEPIQRNTVLERH